MGRWMVKDKMRILLFMFAIVSVSIMSIGYAAFNTELSISGDAYVRVDEDIRITDLKMIEAANGAYEIYNSKYSKDTTSMFVALPNSNSTITYEATIINKSINDYSLVELLEQAYTNTNIKYELIGLNIDDIISSNSKVDFKIMFSSTNVNQESSLILNYNFEIYHKCAHDVGTIWAYNYTGFESSFVTPCDGTYKIELWGARGGNIDGFLGGKGAFTSGDIKLSASEKLFIYVGGMGSDTEHAGGYNGGGIIAPIAIEFGRNGGGATDVRLLSNGLWQDNLKTRIMVAAGGGGANNRNANTDDGTMGYGSGNGGAGGALIGETGQSVNHTIGGGTWGWQIGTGGTQTIGGHMEAYHLNGLILENYDDNYVGKFGFAPQNTNQSGGGSGYYAGASAGHGGAGGGSSFISGFQGCDAVAENSSADNIIHTGQSIHYSGKVFKNSIMLDGNSSMPTYNGILTMLGNDGNGYAKITYLGK